MDGSTDSKWQLTQATEDKTVPSEQITKEAKEAEPDAVEENDKVSCP